MPRIAAAHAKQRTAWMVDVAGILLSRRIELGELLVAAQRREAPDEHRRRDDREDLADERLLVGVEQEARHASAVTAAFGG